MLSMAPTKSLKDQVRRLLEHLQSGAVAPRGTARRWFHRGAQLVSLNEIENAEYEKVARLLVDELAPREEISLTTVERHLNEAIFVARSPLSIDRRSRAELAASKVLSELQRPIKKWQVHFPIVGLYDECLPLTLGTVRFLPSSESLAAIVLLENQSDGADVPAPIRDYARREIGRHFDGKAWASVFVLALEHDADAAKNLALAALELTLDVVNFFADIFRPQEYRARVELASECRNGVQASCSVMDGTEATGVAQARTGPFDNVWLPPLDSNEAIQLGLQRAHGVLLKESRTEVERRLLAALKWAGRGTAVSRLSDKFLAYIMALEALVNGPNKLDQIARSIESRAAQVLSGTNTAPLRHRELERLYDLRSRLLHTGWANISEDDVYSARFYAKECIVKVMVDAHFAMFEKDVEFDGWFAPL